MSEMSEESYGGSAGDRIPDATVPTWILLSSASELAGLIPQGADGKAIAAYLFLNTHVNHHDPDGTTVFPNTDAIASILGNARYDKATAPLQQLHDLGAIEMTRKTKSGSKIKNYYRVRSNPPKGYKGFISRSQFYAWQNAVRERNTAIKTAKRAETIAAKPNATDDQKQAALDANFTVGILSERVKKWSVSPGRTDNPKSGYRSDQEKRSPTPKSGYRSDQRSNEGTPGQTVNAHLPRNRESTYPEIGVVSTSLEVKGAAKARRRATPSLPRPRHCGQRDCDPATRRIYEGDNLGRRCPRCNPNPHPGDM